MTKVDSNSLRFRFYEMPQAPVCKQCRQGAIVSVWSDTGQKLPHDGMWCMICEVFCELDHLTSKEVDQRRKRAEEAVAAYFKTHGLH